jgi:hypothetical protein
MCLRQTQALGPDPDPWPLRWCAARLQTLHLTPALLEMSCLILLAQDLAQPAWAGMWHREGRNHSGMSSVGIGLDILLCFEHAQGHLPNCRQSHRPSQAGGAVSRGATAARSPRCRAAMRTPQIWSRASAATLAACLTCMRRYMHPQHFSPVNGKSHVKYLLRYFGCGFARE